MYTTKSQLLEITWLVFMLQSNRSSYCPGRGDVKLPLNTLDSCGLCAQVVCVSFRLVCEAVMAVPCYAVRMGWHESMCLYIGGFNYVAVVAGPYILLFNFKAET